jgi:hypothetical protein
MKQNDIQKYLQLQEQLMTDEVYGFLLQKYRAKNAEFLAVLEELDPQQRQMIEDYLGICVELHTNMLLLACGQ